MEWKEHQDWEAGWWSTCTNTFWEETKQLVYANKMGLVAEWDYGRYPVFDLKGASVCDIGGGPVSLLLKCKNVDGTVVDPCAYPEWVADRYAAAGIIYLRFAAENIDKVKMPLSYEQIWCYNVLQHTIDPEKIVKNMLAVGKIIRLFEWIEEPVSEGHPHTLHEQDLNTWLRGEGKVEQLNEQGCNGLAYYGVFKGARYAL